MTDDRDGPVSSRRRMSAPTMPEVPLAKLAERAPATLIGGFAIDVGDPAPQFALANEASVSVPLTALRGGPVLIVFGPASEHDALAGALAGARRSLGKHGAASVLVVAGETSLAARIAAPHQQNVVVLADTTGAVHRAYGVLEPNTGRPRIALFLVDSAGDVARVFAHSDPLRLVRLALDAIELAR